MTAEGAAADVANCTLANVIIGVIDIVVLPDIHWLEWLVVEGVDLVAVVEHWIRSRIHGLWSRYECVEMYFTGDTIIVETASRVRLPGGLKAIVNIGSTS